MRVRARRHCSPANGGGRRAGEQGQQGQHATALRRWVRPPGPCAADARRGFRKGRAKRKREDGVRPCGRGTAESRQRGRGAARGAQAVRSAFLRGGRRFFWLGVWRGCDMCTADAACAQGASEPHANADAALLGALQPLASLSQRYTVFTPCPRCMPGPCQPQCSCSTSPGQLRHTRRAPSHLAARHGAWSCGEGGSRHASGAAARSLTRGTFS
mmetsp:Transcript_40156/g.119680  ORF Transcript_40156/g.119680 Transcript_40156/m.119680 type:complete len:214 (+) Transcript_40156:158-799(+)